MSSARLASVMVWMYGAVQSWLARQTVIECPACSGLLPFILRDLFSRVAFPESWVLGLFGWSFIRCGSCSVEFAHNESSVHCRVDGVVVGWLLQFRIWGFRFGRLQSSCLRVSGSAIRTPLQHKPLNIAAERLNVTRRYPRRGLLQ